MAAIAESTEHYTTLARGTHPIKMGTSEPTNRTPMTMMDLWNRRLSLTPDKVALNQKVGDAWVSRTFAEYHAQVMTAAKSMVALGLEEGNGVSILGFNSPEWFIADTAAIFAGGIAAGVYTTNQAEACFYIIDHCNANLVFVEDAAQLAKILSIKDRLTKVKTIVQWSGEVAAEAAAAGVLSWTAFMEAGASVSDADLKARMDKLTPEHTCKLIYTSGTTGNPKAVMITHDNATWTASVTMDMISTTDDEHYVSFLPLSHIAAQALDLVGPIYNGAQVWFARPDALRGTLGATLKEVRPTMFLAVPRVWEKMAETMKAAAAAKAAATGEAPSGPPPAGAVAAMIGLDRCRYIATAAAPISVEVLGFFKYMGIEIVSIYGMSESTGPQTVGLPNGGNKIGAVGRVMPGAELRIDRPDPEGNGEICFRGRHVFNGYMGNPAATAEAIDSEGWLHSGDVGRVDEDGFLWITGRIKELLITAGGENVPPVFIENALKKELPIVSNATVIGDQRKFLSCLFTLRAELNAYGMSTDVPTADVLAVAKKLGSEATTVAAIQTCPLFTAYVQAAVDKYNTTTAISAAQYIQKWAWLPCDFSIPGGELTPTLKLMRRVVNTKYATLIDDLYK